MHDFFFRALGGVEICSAQCRVDRVQNRSHCFETSKTCGSSAERQVRLHPHAYDLHLRTIRPERKSQNTASAMGKILPPPRVDPPESGHEKGLRETAGQGGGKVNQVARGYQARLRIWPRLRFPAVSPWAKESCVDHGLRDHTSIIRLVEDNWQTGRIGEFALDALAGDSAGTFEFTKGPPAAVDP